MFLQMPVLVTLVEFPLNHGFIALIGFISQRDSAASEDRGVASHWKHRMHLNGNTLQNIMTKPATSVR